MVRTAGAETLGAGVYDRLRAAVLGGRYAPGERLRPVELAAEYEVGAGVVREALTRLAEQRLLVAEPNRGYRVMSVSAEQISELVELRRVNECAALRLSVERGDLAWEGRVLAAHHRVDARSARTDDRDVWSLAHKDFHQALISGCGNDRLIALCEELFLESELYRRWSGAVLARDVRTLAHGREGSVRRAPGAAQRGADPRRRPRRRAARGAPATHRRPRARLRRRPRRSGPGRRRRPLRLSRSPAVGPRSPCRSAERRRTTPCIFENCVDEWRQPRVAEPERAPVRIVSYV